MSDLKITPPNLPPRGPTVLCILDGFGYREEVEHNAIKQASTPVYDALWESAPRAMVATSGLDVGLPDGQMGNSEVGHTNIGAGRIVLQDLPRIDAEIAEGTLAGNASLQSFISKLRASGGACHLMGLLSPGGVHSHQDHMVALAKIVSNAGIRVWVHGFLDGRDTPPKSAGGFAQTFIQGLGSTAQIATLSGRYYAMDRDKNWDRVGAAYEALTNGNAGSKTFEDPIEAIAASYADNVTDEFLMPISSAAYPGMDGSDGILMANFRADRAREILSALLDPALDGFERSGPKTFAAAAGMADYSEAHNAFMSTLFPSDDLHGTLGECVAKAGKTQLRIAETEKYAHVTFFLNGGREDLFDGETRKLIPSPKVATYDLQPEMSAPEVTDELVSAIENNAYDLIVVNYANGDMVGHTGIMSAAIKAVEAIDACLGRLQDALIKSGGTMLVTADHGNVELMQDHTSGAPHTAHTTLDVPLLMVNAASVGDDIKLNSGKLSDLAPTLLHILGLECPPEMTGHSLLAHADRPAALEPASR
jgi:2,3-bisphosphoglycerate-independent phosphoglycerate mutase